jgi:hypothetical protein
VTSDTPYANLQDPAKFWLMRVVTLAVIVGAWLLNAHGAENQRVADELRARGQTTTAQDPYKDPFDRWKERSQVRLSPMRAYLYVVDGVEYRHTTSKREFDPVGKTVTYMPEDPNIHQVGEVVPEAGMPWWGYVVFPVIALLLGGVTVAFFLIALLPPGEPEPTRVGWWCIVLLAAIQFTTALVTTTFFRVPFSTLLTQGVPLFVGGTVLAVAGVRLSAWSRGVALREPVERTGLISARAAAPPLLSNPAGTAATLLPRERPVAVARLPWAATLRAAFVGAVACLLLALLGFLIMHATAFLFRLAGASWSWVAFFTSAESILMDLIIGSIAATFGGIRGVVHHAGDLPNSKKTYGEIAEKAVSDLCSIRNPTGSLEDGFERIACLLLAVVLASPLIVILLLVWFRS